MTTYRVCWCFHRKFRAAANGPPKPIKDLFSRYSDNGLMGLDHLQRFLVEVQGETSATREMAQKILESHRDFKHVFQKKALNLDGFFRYLAGDANPPLNPSLGVYQDMTAPLSHYFIYTGHNSYLTGNQLSSDASDIPIINALRRGVRVIELDIWPNSTNTEVEVRHGRTFTTPAEFIKCVRSIRENAFVASPYPVIITLEDHLTPDLQAKVAQILIETFGEMLFYPKSESLEEFPSPEDLKLRIMISTKPPKEFLESKSMKDKEHELQKKSEEEPWGESDGDSKHKIEDDHDERYHEEEDHDDGDQFYHQPTAPEYKHLIAVSAKKGSLKELSDSLKGDPHKVSRLSLSEQSFAKAIVSHGPEIIRFTQRNLLRIYPKGTRVTSSNYNPVLGWMHGAQMVALNMQGYGRSLWLVHGMFRANGGCGYVKKPDFLLNTNQGGQVFNPNTALPIKKVLKVRVYMGDGWQLDFHRTHFDQYSPPDFYTRIGIAGVSADTVMMRTKAVEDNWTPVWDEEFIFPLTVPELALLRIEVHEYDLNKGDDFGGQTCLPVWELRSGIRAIPLCNRKGEKLNHVKLLMRFDFL